MNLKTFFSLIIGILFQRNGSLLKNRYGSDFQDTEQAYDNVLFYCPCVFAMDGMSISLQIHNGNYCQSDAGYRAFSQNWIEVEFGFPKGLNDLSSALLAPYGECNSSEDTVLTSDVGRVSLEILEEIYKLHGGIDWERTCKCENIFKG